MCTYLQIAQPDFVLIDNRTQHHYSVTINIDQCDFRFDLFFSFSFVLVLQYFFVLVFVFKPADEDVLMICLNTVHR